MEPYEDEAVIELRRQKQEFLKNEIINRGYEGSYFSDYLNSKREEGGNDIDMWSLEELKGAVIDFRRIMDEYRAKEGGQENYEVLDAGQQGAGDDSNPNSATLSTEYSHQSKDDIHVIDNTKDEIYSHIIKVRTCEPSPLNDEKNVKVIVGEPEMVKGGLFSASFIQYKVTTMPFGWSVKRRFSDFFWLRSVIQKQHLGYVIPPVPQKKNKGKFENDFIRKRMYFLEKFLNSCVVNEEFKSNKFLYFFLNLEDENQFKVKRKEGDALRKVSRLEEVSNLAGEIPLDINANLKYYAAHAGELFNQTDPIYKKIRKLSKQLTVDLDQVSNTIFSIGECYAALYAATTNFNKNVAMGKNPYLDDIYLTLNNMMVSWGEQTLGQIKIVQKNMVYFYKYGDYENETFREIVQGRARTGLEYIQKKKELIAKKERLFLQQDLTRWELTPAAQKEHSRETLLKNKSLAFDVMLPRETHMVRELRDTFAYQNSLTYTELDKCLHEKCKEYSSNFHDLAKSQAENLTEVHVHWADLMAHFTESKLKSSGNAQIKDRASVQQRVQHDEFAGAEDS